MEKTRDGMHAMFVGDEDARGEQEGRQRVEIDPVVAGVLARSGFELAARGEEMERIAKGWKPS